MCDAADQNAVDKVIFLRVGLHCEPNEQNPFDAGSGALYSVPDIL